MPISTNATIANVISSVQGTVASLTGMRAAPLLPPEQINVFPFGVAYPVSGVITRMSGWLQEEHLLALEIHIARKDLPRDVGKALPFLRSVPEALWADPTLAGTVETLQEIRYGFGLLDWASQQTLGFRFELPVLLTIPITTPTWDTPSGPDEPQLLQTMTQIQALVVRTVRAAPALPVEQLPVFPYSLVYPKAGRIKRMTDWNRELHTLALEIHVARKDLPRDAETAYPFARSVPMALWRDPTLAYMTSTVNEIRYTFGPLDWAGPEGETRTLGFRFEIDTKVNV